jgi:hypothetical protein
MGYTHPKLAEFQKKLEALFREVDADLEDIWSGSFTLHPNRPRRGETSNPEMDGLFNVGPDFTPGIGSEKGRGYIINLRVATLEKVDPAQYEFLMELAAALVRRRLPEFFPERSLQVVRDGPRFKITGDFSLGDA